MRKADDVAREWIASQGGDPDRRTMYMGNAPVDTDELAALIASVRNETLEEAAKAICERREPLDLEMCTRPPCGEQIGWMTTGGRMRRERVAREVRDIIVSHGAPMTRTPIVRSLEDRGLRVTGAKAATNIGTIMWRLRHLFVNIEGFGYWPRDLPYQPAGYEPPPSAP